MYNTPIHSETFPINHSTEAEYIHQSKYDTSDICIPRVKNTITKEYVYNVFCRLNIGRIKRITEIPLRGDSDHKRVFIRVQWNEKTHYTQYMKQRFTKGETIKIIHDDSPWYWKVFSGNPAYDTTIR
jgi:hypothetical protein